MTDLIERLEASEGSRELDFAVHELCTGELIVKPDLPPGYTKIWHVSDAVPHYTTSLDAALTLVPEGWLFEKMVSSTKSHEGYGTLMEITGWSAWLMPKARERGRRIGENRQSRALALCIAALKARAAP